MQKKQVRTRTRLFSRHHLLKLIAGPLLIVALALPLAAQAEVEHWVGSWATAPFAQTNPLQSPDFAGATFRQIVRVSLGGRALRVRFTNEFGTEPLTLDAVHVALSAGHGEIQPQTDRPVTFGGKPSITIPVDSIALLKNRTQQANSGLRRIEMDRRSLNCWFSPALIRLYSFESVCRFCL